jgi:hypothetical protein
MGFDPFRIPALDAIVHWTDSWQAVVVPTVFGFGVGLWLGYRHARCRAWLLLPLLAWAGIAWLSVAYRVWGVVLVAGAAALHVACAAGQRRWRLVGLSWVVAFASCLLPWDISFQNYPGPAHFVPMAMGLPGQEMVLAARNAEIMLGGCVVTGFEPRYVLVW